MDDEARFAEEQKDWPLFEGQFRLPDGRIAEHVPEDHAERVEFFCRRHDARRYLYILAEAAKELDNPESLWSKIADAANTERRRFIAAACTIREQVWEEYKRGEIEWGDPMAEELERRWHAAWEAIPWDDYKALIDAAASPDKQLSRLVSDHLVEQLDEAAEDALGIHYRKVPTMHEIPDPTERERADA